MAEDIEWCEAEGMPYGDPPFYGPQEVAYKVFGPITTDIAGFAVAPGRYLSSGDVIVALGRYLGTGRRPEGRSIPPSRTAKFLEDVQAAVATVA